MLSIVSAVIISGAAMSVVVEIWTMMTVVMVVSSANYIAQDCTAGHHADHAHDVTSRTHIHGFMSHVTLIAVILTAVLIAVVGALLAFLLAMLRRRICVAGRTFFVFVAFARWLVGCVENFAVTEFRQFFNTVDLQSPTAFDLVGVGFQSFDRVFVLLDQTLHDVELEFIRFVFAVGIIDHLAGD